MSLSEPILGIAEPLQQTVLNCRKQKIRDHAKLFLLYSQNRQQNSIERSKRLPPSLIDELAAKLCYFGIYGAVMKLHFEQGMLDEAAVAERAKVLAMYQSDKDELMRRISQFDEELHSKAIGLAKHQQEKLHRLGLPHFQPTDDPDKLSTQVAIIDFILFLPPEEIYYSVDPRTKQAVFY
ncbi:unnamed protein product, partial [Mesorhabditis spiculigera]